MRKIVTFAILLAATAPASAQTKEHAPAGLASSARMRHDQGESWTYVKPGLNLGRYRSILVLPTAVYTGADAQFNDVTPAERQKYAGIITAELRSELGKAIPLAASASPDTLQMRVTLLGANGTKGGVATASRVMPVGLALSAVKSLRGKPGSFTGSMLYAVELADSRTGELQVAAVRRQAPDALDIGATLSTSDTIHSAARDFAQKATDKLARAMRPAGR